VLQWGRGFVAAETTRAQPPPAGPERFNGAAAL